MVGPEFLKKRFNLHASKEVESAARRTRIRTGEKIPQNPNDRIQNYLDRFKEIVERKDEDKKRLGLRALRKVIHDANIIKAENVPESHFRLLQQIDREHGLGMTEITQERKEDAIRTIQADQRTSLDGWFNYLTSDDARYPDWAKYWAFRSVLAMSLYDKEKHQYGNRSKHTTAPFPELNSEAVAYAVDAIVQLSNDDKIPNPVERSEAEYDNHKVVSDEEFQHLLSTENFSKYYAFAMEHVVVDHAELLKIIDGEWRKFRRGSDPHELTKSLQGRGTGWCTAGQWTARDQLEEGDFHVYFSKNNLGESVIPRLAIRMQDERIAEVRGIAPHQEIDPYIAPVLEAKLDEFGKEAEEYKKKAGDMKQLTAIDVKTKAGEELTVDELKFLYEVDEEIEGFGFTRDPRIDELIEKRDKQADIRLILGGKNDNEFILSFLGVSDRLRAKFLGVKRGEYNDGESEIDYDDYDQKLPEFLEKTLLTMRGLTTEVAEKLAEHGFGALLMEARNSFEFKDKFGLLQILKEYDEEHGHNLFEEAVEGYFANEPLETVVEFLGTQLGRGDAAGIEELILQTKNIPIPIAQQLVKIGREDLLAKGLHNFQAGLDSKIALSLINAGHIGAISENLALFRLLNKRIRDEFIDAGYEDVVRANPKSFDRYLKVNPFGQFIDQDPEA